MDAKGVIITKMMPISEMKSTLTAAVMNRSTSLRTFCSLPSVSPLRCLQYLIRQSSECRMPSEYMRALALHDHVHEVILKVFRHPRHKRTPPRSTKSRPRTNCACVYW